MFLYVGGNAGVGQSQIITAIVASFIEKMRSSSLRLLVVVDYVTKPKNLGSSEEGGSASETPTYPRLDCGVNCEAVGVMER